ncbi:hypothetical protein, partial [Xylella fastidiosa]|uniref:hypothetical protein n=1 Tax=Xylella fastidiosa TaxID=2371 RepID=UPI0013969C0C
LASGRTPYLAAFAGITGCIVVGLLNPFQRLRWRDLYEAFETGAKYALASTPISRNSGISVGQRILNDWRSLGISASV